ncbi:MAG TPA: hypothetical protein VK386_05095 [Acidimicrobiales bacterium]|nr:hypothetical protein [Acidimicrobiales bacterium]
MADPVQVASLKWLDDVADHDFDAAFNYLSLRWTDKAAEKMVTALRQAKLTTRRSNDILRACNLNPLPIDDPGVRRDLGKVIDGKKLSPVLVVSHSVGADIADGYHRVSLAYNIDPFAPMPLRIAFFEPDT